MRVLVTGGRKYSNYSALRKVLDRLHKKFGITLIIHGGAAGADALADRWARENEVPCLRHPAKWKTGKHGKAEGPIRNNAMLRWEPDLVVACPGDKGTQNMIGLATAEDIEIVRVPDA